MAPVPEYSPSLLFYWPILARVIIQYRQKSSQFRFHTCSKIDILSYQFHNGSRCTPRTFEDVIPLWPHVVDASRQCHTRSSDVLPFQQSTPHFCCNGVLKEQVFESFSIPFTQRAQRFHIKPPYYQPVFGMDLPISH